MATRPIGADQVVHLVELLLPLNENTGRPVPKAKFEQVRKTLLERFGGLTAYAQAPAVGLWKDDEDGTSCAVRDMIVVYEVMVEQLDAGWWTDYRRELELEFGQEELVVRAHCTQRL